MSIGDENATGAGDGATAAKKPARRPPSLGRGLSALLGEDVTAAASGMLGAEAAGEGGATLRRLAITDLEPNPEQPRRDFDEQALRELAASLKAKGLLQPILARPHPSLPGKFQIIAGERRWRAAQLARLHDLPVLVRRLQNDDVLESALIENIHRSDLNPLEEADALQRLMTEHGHTQETLSELLGRSRSHIANTLRLLQLPPQARQLLAAGQISAGHARPLLGLSAAAASKLAARAATEKLSVRETEKLAEQADKAATAPDKAPGRAAPSERRIEIVAVEYSLSQMLGLPVSISHSKKNRGRISIRYGDLDQFDVIVTRLSGLPKPDISMDIDEEDAKG